MGVFMDKIMKDILKDIAGTLEYGMDCYYNPNTAEVISIPNEDALMDCDDADEIFGEDLKKVESKKVHFVKIKVPENSESYEIMKDFKDEVSDAYLNRQLTAALNNRKPFQHFKHLIDNSQYRQKWFAFKREALENYVRRQLEMK
jgi:hypothetical protein